MARGSVLRRALKTECRELRRRTALESLASEAWLVGRRLETQQKSLRHLSGCTERPAEHQETASCYPTSSDSDGVRGLRYYRVWVASNCFPPEFGPPPRLYLCLAQRAKWARPRDRSLVRRLSERREHRHGEVCYYGVCSAQGLSRAESSHSLPVRPCQGSGPGSRPAATSASRPR